MRPGTEAAARRIAIVAHDCGLRGAERVVAEEATLLRSRGWDVTVLVPCGHGDLSGYLQSQSVRVVVIRYYWWMGPGRFLGRGRRILGNLLALPRLIRLFRSGGFDIVHSHSIACGIGAVAARLAGVPHVWHLHESGPYGTSSDRPSFDLGERLSVVLARWTNSHFLAVSSTIARLYERKLGLPQVSVVYQAVGLERSSAVGPAMARLSSWPGKMLVIVGSIVPLKDQKTAVRAMTAIVKAWPGTGLFLIGDDPLGMGSEIDALARELGVADNVVRLGTMANAAPAIAAADGCIVTALDEGFGRVAVEAMLTETPVISADVAVNREVAGEGNADFFAPSDPLSLAGAVNTVFERPEQNRRERLARAKSFARQKFSSTAATDALEAELLACLDRPAPENTGIEIS